MLQLYNFSLNAISGSGALQIQSPAGATSHGHLLKPCTYDGPTVIKGSVSLEQGGRIVNSQRIDLYKFLRTYLNAVPIDRIADDIPLNCYEQSIFENSNADETLGDMNLYGIGLVNGYEGILRVTRLNRMNRGTAKIADSSTLGTTGGPRIFIGTVDGSATTNYLVGGGGAAGTKNISILPFLHGTDSFATYSGADGIRLLDANTEFSTDITTAGASDNVYITNNVALTSSTTINSLMFKGNWTLSGSYPLTITSGAILFRRCNATISASSLNFAGREAVLTLWNDSITINQTINAVITNANGLTVGTYATGAGTGKLTLGGLNVYTGRTTILSGASLLISGTDRLPVSTVMYIATGGEFYLNDQNQTLAGLEGTGSVDTKNALRRLTLNLTGDYDFAGAITRNITLRKTGAGMQTLSGASSYYGITEVLDGTLRVNGSLSANASAVSVSGNATLSGTGTINRAVSIAAGTLAPGKPTGALTVSSNVTLTAASTLHVTVGAGGVSQLLCDSVVDLGNYALVVTVEDGYTPPTTPLEIVSAGGISGTIATTDIGTMTMSITSTKVILTPAPRPSGTTFNIR